MNFHNRISLSNFMEDNIMNLGKKIILLRKQKGITQEELAEVINVTRQTISKWELNQSTPDLEYLAAISEYFGVTTDYLIKDVVKEPQPEVFDERPKNATETISRTSISGNLGIVLIAVSFIMFLLDIAVLGTGVIAVVTAVSLVMGICLVVNKKYIFPVTLTAIWVCTGPFCIVGTLKMIRGFGLPLSTILWLIYTVAVIAVWVIIIKKNRAQNTKINQ